MGQKITFLRQHAGKYTNILVNRIEYFIRYTNSQRRCSLTSYNNKEQRTTNQITRNTVLQILVQQNYLIFSASDIKLQTAFISITVMILSFRTDMPEQTVQTQIRLLLEEQSDQGLHCLPFRLHRLDPLLYGKAT